MAPPRSTNTSTNTTNTNTNTNNIVYRSQNGRVIDPRHLPLCAARASQPHQRPCPHRVWVYDVPGRSAATVSLYCQHHTCRKPMEGGGACDRVSSAAAKYCRHHLICSAMVGPQRCGQPVKNGNAAKYRYCQEYHGCLEQECTQPRCLDPTDLRYCASHRCPVAGCARPRMTAGGYCANHTCEVASCGGS
ncbi:hypothetical protein E4U41_004203, partial [Claviceps citrina]